MLRVAPEQPKKRPLAQSEVVERQERDPMQQWVLGEDRWTRVVIAGSVGEPVWMRKREEESPQAARGRRGPKSEAAMLAQRMKKENARKRGTERGEAADALEDELEEEARDQVPEEPPTIVRGRSKRQQGRQASRRNSQRAKEPSP